MINPLDAYRRTLASAEDGSETSWWYLGTGIVEPEGVEPIIVNHIETVMIYGSQSLGDGAFRIPWWEIGLFRDALTGELASQWANPVTGQVLPASRMFEEGPSGYSLRRAPSGGIEIFDAVQAFAELESSSIEVRELGDRLRITQTEHKQRSFPEPEGRIPDISEGKAVRSRTVLQFYASRAEIESGAPSVAATGMYSFELATPAFLGFGDTPSRFAVRGLMHKAQGSEPLNPRGWADLQSLFPQYFDGEILRPRWD